MTNLQALQSTISYNQVDANAYTRVLIDRGLNAGDEYVGKQDAVKFQAFELAKADLYSELITAANISEADYSISVSERSNFIKLAGGIYTKYGEVNPFAEVVATPTVTGASPW